jgi:Putative sensor
MPDTRTLAADSAIDRIFGPVIQAQTWINTLYLLISFPLGVVYFVALVTIFCLGLGLIPVFAGLFVIWFGFMMSDALAELERVVMNAMLGAAIPPRAPAPLVTGNVFRRMAAAVARPGTFKRWIYLWMCFPMGIASFVLVCIFIPMSLALLTAPLTYTFIPFNIGTARIETFDEAIYLCCFGAVLALASVHVLNSWTAVCRRFGRAMLA